MDQKETPVHTELKAIQAMSKEDRKIYNSNKLISTIGRPHARHYTKEDIQLITEDISNKITTGSNLVEILNSSEIYPNPSTFFKWCINDESINKMYNHAREVRAHTLVEEIFTTIEGKGIEDSMVAVARDRLKSDTVKWYASKVIPKLYGDKLNVEVENKSVVHINLGCGIDPLKQIEDVDFIDITPE